jgi:hypothetical protein
MENYSDLQKLKIESNKTYESWQSDLFDSAKSLHQMLVDRLDPPRTMLHVNNRQWERIMLEKPFFESSKNGFMAHMLLSNDNFREFIKNGELLFAISLNFSNSESNNSSVSITRLLISVRFKDRQPAYAIYDPIESKIATDWMSIEDIFGKIISDFLENLKLDPYLGYVKPRIGFS